MSVVTARNKFLGFVATVDYSKICNRIPSKEIKEKLIAKAYKYGIPCGMIFLQSGLKNKWKKITVVN